MKKIFILIMAFMLLSITAYTQQSIQESFKSSLCNALTKNDTAIMMSITCMDKVTADWQKMMLASYGNLLPILQKKGTPSISFTAFTDPAPLPVKYGDKMLVPNLPITTICTVTFPADPDKADKTEFRLGEKDGKLLNTILVPQKD